MLNYETILSSYDDKMTLMQWLKKVEEALKHASATAFRVNKKGNATISFILDFEDGTTLESGDIVLQQGESVNGAYIENNHLFITLTNGQAIDAGLLFSGDINVGGTITCTNVNCTNVNATGEVTANLLKENMVGYRFFQQQISGWVINYDYAGIVKTGNKITMSIALRLNRSNEAITYGALGEFSLPHAVMEKLRPSGIDNQVLTILQPYAYYDENGNGTTLRVKVRKQTAYDRVDFYLIAGSGSLTAGTMYYARMEVTFLLSDSLTSN